MFGSLIVLLNNQLRRKFNIWETDLAFSLLERPDCWLMIGASELERRHRGRDRACSCDRDRWRDRDRRRDREGRRVRERRRDCERRRLRDRECLSDLPWLHDLDFDFCLGRVRELDCCSLRDNDRDRDLDCERELALGLRD